MLWHGFALFEIPWLFFSCEVCMFHVFFVLNCVNVVISQIEMSFEHVFIFHDGCDFLDRFGKLKDCYIIGPCHPWRLLLMRF